MVRDGAERQLCAPDPPPYLGGMLARLGQRLSAVFRATAPDPFVLAIALTALTYLLAWLTTDATASQTLDYWAGGIWSLLTFAMQMSLILVTGAALAASPPIARVLRRIASTPRTGRQAVWMTSAVAILFGLFNWGLGLIVGAILARDVGRAMRARSVAVPYPLLAAAGYTALLCWHGGLSGSAPLQAANAEDLADLISPDLQAAVGELPVSVTIFSWFNLVTTGGLVIIVPFLLAMLCPKGQGESRVGIVQCVTDQATRLPAERARAEAPPAGRGGALPEWLDRSPLVVWLLAAPALIWLGRLLWREGLDALDLNTANLLFLALGLALHGSATRYMDAATEAASGCAGIIIQFPIYAGIMGMMRESGLARELSSSLVALSGGTAGGLSIATFLSAGLVNLFVPSGGGQWAIQAPVALQAGVDAGVEGSRLVMAVSYGDQWTNMLQPFWALPLLGITGVQARDLVGYTAVALVGAGIWMGGCLVAL